MREAPGCFLEWPDQVQPPYRERLGDGDGLECLRREMDLSCIELATLTVAHNVPGVSDGGWPIEALSERLFDKSPRGRVMSARSVVDLA